MSWCSPKELEQGGPFVCVCVTLARVLGPVCTWSPFAQDGKREGVHANICKQEQHDIILLMTSNHKHIIYIYRQYTVFYVRKYGHRKYAVFTCSCTEFTLMFQLVACDEHTSITNLFLHPSLDFMWKQIKIRLDNHHAMSHCSSSVPHLARKLKLLSSGFWKYTTTQRDAPYDL